MTRLIRATPHGACRKLHRVPRAVDLIMVAGGAELRAAILIAAVPGNQRHYHRPLEALGGCEPKGAEAGVVAGVKCATIEREGQQLHLETWRRAWRACVGLPQGVLLLLVVVVLLLVSLLLLRGSYLGLPCCWQACGRHLWHPLRRPGQKELLGCCHCRWPHLGWGMVGTRRPRGRRWRC